eukprot:TRINITY_DN30792_c0_g1_i1.p2 TRINITY_DN30792_c0_g1~~TRINITY_DN30792_c0_g1_i1.p2  ORF type:complete len:147 (-),score=29.32 TRINITY_DN30792_c0_g1_i1:47-487(-)
MVGKFINTLNEHKEQISQRCEENGISLEKIKKCGDLKCFNNKFTKKYFNITDLDEYQNQLSCQEKLKDIKIPTLFINARDDRVLGNIPIGLVQQCENFVFAVTRKGGHLHWFTGLLPKRWVFKPVSYTHLTLPTKRIVLISVVAVF